MIALPKWGHLFFTWAHQRLKKILSWLYRKTDCVELGFDLTPSLYSYIHSDVGRSLLYTHWDERRISASLSFANWMRGWQNNFCVDEDTCSQGVNESLCPFLPRWISTYDLQAVVGIHGLFLRGLQGQKKQAYFQRTRMSWHKLTGKRQHWFKKKGVLYAVLVAVL